MSLEETLKELESQSDSIANIQLKQGSTPLIDSLLSRKRSYVRDADQNENKVGLLCMGEPLSNVINITPDPRDVGSILKTVTELNEICKNPEVENRILEMQGEFDDIKLNISNYKVLYSQNEMEIDRLTIKNTERNTNTIMDYEEEELEIERLQAELQKKRGHNRELSKRKMDQIRIGEDIKTMTYSLQSTNENTKTIKDIENLKSQIEDTEKRISSYNEYIEASQQDELDHNDTSFTLNELLNIILSKIESSLSNTSQRDGNSKTLDNVISDLENIEKKLKQALTKIEKMKVIEEKVKKAKSIFYEILIHVNNRIMHVESMSEDNVDFEKFNEAFPLNTKTTVPQLPLKKDSLVFTCILLKLYTEGDMPLHDLTAYVQDLTREHELPAASTNTAIYKLAVTNLVFIDRSHKDSLVKLKLNM